MISDNFVTGDNVYLNELKNFFFEVLGMMSITHYGCIGDGRYDNYGPLQVAIEDAIRRGLCYLYVPYGRFRFRGELQHLESVTFIGNPRAKIYNDSTGEEIEIKQFGVMGCCRSEVVKTLSADITLEDGVDPGLDSGIYYTGEHQVFYGLDLFGPIPLINQYEPFYYNADDKTFCTPAYQIYLTSDTGKWEKYLNDWNTNEIVDDDYRIPTSGAVYRALQNINIERDMITCALEQDHTLSGSSSESLPLTQREIIGSNFTVNNNGEVVVGSNISRVKVSGMFTIEDFNSATSSIACYVAKNNNSCCDTFAYDTSGGSTSALVSSSIPTFLLAVSQGDILQLRARGTSGVKFTGESTSLYNYLTVEAVEYGGDSPTPPPTPEPEYIEFRSACHPSSWTLIPSVPACCTGVNEYGLWEVQSQYAGPIEHQKIDQMWRNDISGGRNYYCPSNETFEVILNCPTGISVKPSQIDYTLSVYEEDEGTSTSLVIFGMEEGTNTWTQLQTVAKSSSVRSVSISTDKYFTKFKVTRQVIGEPSGKTHVRMNIKRGIIKDAREI